MAAPAPSVLRTPDGAFSKLEASGLYPFDPHYVHVTAALRMHVRSALLLRARRIFTARHRFLTTPCSSLMLVRGMAIVS